jgi:hypothetical protein
LLLLLPTLQVADNGELQLVDATDGWKSHTPLYLAIVLSLVIAVLCALLVVGMLLLSGLELLAKVNRDLQVSPTAAAKARREAALHLASHVCHAKLCCSSDLCSRWICISVHSSQCTLGLCKPWASVNTGSVELDQQHASSCAAAAAAAAGSRQD